MKKNFRFYDNRQKYLLFVTTTNEKNQIADAIRPHVNKIKPVKPGIKIFDAGMGDGSLLMNVMRQCHAAKPTIPLLVSTKEISIWLLYTSDAAADMQCVDLGGRRIIKKNGT